MVRFPVVKTFLPVMCVLLLASACAGPEEHRRPSVNSALSASSAAADRPAAGAVLDPESPLDVGEKPAPAKPHQHHPGMQMPAPEEKPAPEKPADAKPHVHPTSAAPAPELVEDPVCHMKIKPEKAGGGSLTVNGVKSYFCSSSCRAKFLAANPEAK